MILALLMATVAAGAMTWAGVKSVRRYTAARSISDNLPVIALPKTQVSMLATIDASQQLTSVTMFVLAPASVAADGTVGAQVGGSIVSIPISADSTHGQGDSRLSLREAYAQGGDDGLSAAAEGLLSLTLDYMLVVDAKGAAALLASIGDIPVTLPSDVLARRSGKDDVVLRAGQHTLKPEQAASVLTSSTSSQADRARRPGLEAVWSGVVMAIGPGKVGEQLAGEVASFDDVLRHLISGPVASRGLPTEPIEASKNPDGLDVDGLDEAEEILVFASIAPSAMSAPRPGLSVRIQAPPGSEAKLKQAISLAIYFGDNVVSASLSGTVQPETLYFIYENRNKERVASDNALLGTLKFPKVTERISGIDITISLGSEFLNMPINTAPATTVPVTAETGGA